MASVSVCQLLLYSVKNHAGLAELVWLAGRPAAHIVISDGRVFAFKLYSNLPGSEKERKKE